MSNWTSLTPDFIRTAKIGTVLDTVQSAASARGEADPTMEMILDVVAQIRSSISLGNSLDVDPTKIPNSLKGLALRLLTRRLKDYIELPLTSDELKQADDDRSYLNRIIDNKIRFETPDQAAGSGEMQPGGKMEVVTVNTRFMTQNRMKGL